MEHVESLLAGAIAQSSSRSTVNELVHVCREIAHDHLRTKKAQGHLDPGLFQLTLSELALDCVGPLFQRDEEGRLTRIADYFHSDLAAEQNPAGKLRRLVRRTVEDELHLLYGSVDPNLSKLIRNLKSAVRNDASAELRRVDGDAWIYIEPPETATHTETVIPAETLARLLTPHLRHYAEGPDLIEALKRILTEQARYKKAVPLTRLARSARRGLRILREIAPPIDESDVEKRVEARETEFLIRLAAHRIKAHKRSHYIGNDKLNASRYSSYFEVVASILVDRYVHQGKTSSYYTHFRQYIPVRKATYRSTHRGRIEYLVNQTEEEFLSMIDV